MKVKEEFGDNFEIYFAFDNLPAITVTTSIVLGGMITGGAGFSVFSQVLPYFL